jgi:succinate dehydrogenase/fumarate reductase flavoprotein subunit
LSDGEIEGRRQITEYFRFLRHEVPGFENSAIVEIAPQVGIRESRRVRGLYQLSGADIISSAQFSDGIGINAWPMELHRAGGIDWVFPDDTHNAFNELPWRMLLPVGVSNLLVAGRCASMSHEGQSAARASGGCFVMGQAAGTAAALWLQSRANGSSGALTDLSVTALQAALKQDGVLLSARSS